MDTDQRQTLLGINQGKDLERLNSDVMNQKISPNAKSQELVKLNNTLACLKNTLRSTWVRQRFGCSAWITLRSSRTSLCCETGMWDGHMNAVTALLNLFAATGHLYYYRRRVCVCVFAKLDQFLPVRSHFDTKRPVNVFHIATFPYPTFGPLFAFHCPLFFTKNNNLHAAMFWKVTVNTQDRPLNRKHLQPLTRVVQWESARLRS